MVVLSHEGYNIEGLEDQGVTAPRGNPRAAAPGAWPLRQPLWAGPNTHTGGGSTAPMTNTITIL
jgi:hypothetical protein